MLRFLTAVGALALLALAGFTQAHGADLSLAPMGKAPAYSPSSTCLYVGAEFGASIASANADVFNTGTGTVSFAAPRVGGVIGCDKQLGPFLIWLEGDFDYSWARGGSQVAGAGVSFTDSWQLTQRLAIGIPLSFLGNATPHVDAGLTEHSTGVTVTGVASGTQWLAAPFIGGGLDIPLGKYMALDIVYDHVFAKGYAINGVPGMPVVGNAADDRITLKAKWPL